MNHVVHVEFFCVIGFEAVVAGQMISSSSHYVAITEREVHRGMNLGISLSPPRRPPTRTYPLGECRLRAEVAQRPPGHPSVTDGGCPADRGLRPSTEEQWNLHWRRAQPPHQHSNRAAS